MFKTFAALTAIALVQVAPAFADDRGPAPTLTVVGEAEEEVRPDIAIISLNVVDDRATPAEAAAENARLTTAVVDGLKGSGVDAKDIATVGLSLTPILSEQRDPKSNQVVKTALTGYHASNVLRVRLREIDRAGALIAASVQNGALYQSIAFELSDRAAQEDALRIKAVENAAHRAALYAQGAQLKLGPLRNLNAGAGRMTAEFAAPRAMAAAALGATPLSIEPGMLTLNETVNATYELSPP